METFNIQIQPPYDSKFKSPEILGTYAMDCVREWQERMDSFVKKGRVILGGDNFYNEGIKPLLKWIHHQSEWSHSDFVVSRGSLSKMMRTPYEEKEPWMFTVTKYKGTIYIKAEQTEYERIQSDTIDTQKQHIFKWGYKFEDYLTQKSTSNLNDIVNTNQQNHVVYQREIDGYNILYGAEVDAVMHDRATPLRLKDCVEFKVNLEITSNQHYKIFAKRKFFTLVDSVLFGRDSYNYMWL
ncbi:RAI1 [Lepeophtheirus salmonis]|uniref:Decapping nuclease n=1 Tax=Lepeophtheirus salmonis TaxID=72036 RepID=A0A7R8CL98_LEPSM|nr:RAI1 [Lepeophtheirus salmonis]CAF2826437.1 RAI1 [Lepeophtheirus salmonis]